jgi:hypothetical protein
LAGISVCFTLFTGQPENLCIRTGHVGYAGEERIIRDMMYMQGAGFDGIG